MDAQSLSIDGCEYSTSSLIDKIDKVVHSHAPEWERAVYRFMGEWISGSPTVELMTSGSTGAPKTIAVDKQRMVASALMTQSALSLRSGMRALLCLPMEFVAAKMFVVRCFVSGLDLHIVKPGLSPMADVAGHIDVAAMTPPQLEATLAGGNLGRIGTLIVGGAPIPDQTERRLRDARCRVVATYGMTETLTHIALRNVNGPERSEWFAALPGVAVSLDNRDCLVIDAPAVNPEAVVTNDTAEIAGEGRFRILGRSDNVINSGGLKLSAEAIEEKIRPLMRGRAFFVGPVADERFGQRPALYIDGSPDGFEAPDLGSVLEKQEVPACLIFTPRFAYTESGKLRRIETAALAGTRVSL
jgi:O-succinylbenzoic acid--CoA ligase